MHNSLVLDVTGEKDVEGQPIGVANNTGKKNQRWKILYIDEKEKTETKGLNEEFGFHINRPFYIVSQLPFNRVIEWLDHANDYKRYKTNAVIRRWKKNRKQQQFWFDEVSKTIRNNFNKNYCIDIYNNGAGTRLRMNGVTSRWYQLWRKDGDYIVNIKNKSVFDVKDGLDNEN